MRRRFNTRERAALFCAADGKCQGCGAELEPRWHADHEDPFSRGGETDVTNGAALCPDCNLRKGAMKLRDWQKRFLQESDREQFLLVACPGAGKTTAALYALRRWWSPGSRVIVVVPTEHLKHQWKQAAWAAIGLELSPDFSNGSAAMPRDLDGISVTYQQVASCPLLFRQLAGKKRTMVILDEIHHCGDDGAWGNAVRQAFERCDRRLGLSGTPFRSDRRLGLSGTPFRSDSSQIPFVRYQDGESVASSPYGFSYGYGEALSDGVCREIYFPAFEGSMQWMSRGDVKRAGFADSIPKEEWPRRLRTALDAGSDWMASMIRRAHEELLAEREIDRKAGGIVLAIDTTHAAAIAKLIRETVGVDPVIATSEQSDAGEQIKAFRESNKPWIVAVRMVSEGVDIPRLKVLVYATNITEELFFRQAVGRISRGEGMAHCFLPADPRLIDLAQRIQEERNHTIEEMVAEAKREASEQGEQQSFFVPLGATGADLLSGHLSGEEFSRAEIDRAESVRQAVNSKVSAIEVARLLRAASAAEPSTPAPKQDISPDTRKNLRKRLNTLVRRWAHVTHSGKGRPDFRTCQLRANTEPHGHYVKIDEATIGELTAAIEWVGAQIKRA